MEAGTQKLGMRRDWQSKDPDRFCPSASPGIIRQEVQEALAPVLSLWEKRGTEGVQTACSEHLEGPMILGSMADALVGGVMEHILTWFGGNPPMPPPHPQALLFGRSVTTQVPTRTSYHRRTQAIVFHVSLAAAQKAQELGKVVTGDHEGGEWTIRGKGVSMWRSGGLQVWYFGGKGRRPRESVDCFSFPSFFLRLFVDVKEDAPKQYK